MILIKAERKYKRHHKILAGRVKFLDLSIGFPKQSLLSV
jgi:hypothetical protein